MKTIFNFRNLHLIISSVVVIPIALVYGFCPTKTLPYLFDFEVTTIDLSNIFHAIMGLYFAFALFWMVGIKKSEYWQSATISNMLFMGGLAIGRIISFFDDGVPSLLLFFGTIGEMILAAWAYYQFRLEKNSKQSV